MTTVPAPPFGNLSWQGKHVQSPVTGSDYQGDVLVPEGGMEVAGDHLLRVVEGQHAGKVFAVTEVDPAAR